MSLRRRELLSVVLTIATATAVPAQSLVFHPVHLGVAGQPEWDSFSGSRPSAESLTVTFEASPNDGEHSLVIHQSDVKQDWRVEINGTRIGALVRMEADLVQVLPVPAETLRAGSNSLRISSTTPSDDVVIGAVRIEPVPMATLFGSRLRVQVTGDDSRPLPARVTIVDASGALTPLQAVAGSNVAVRPGVAYTAGEPVHVSLLPGTYRVRATRGPEYGTDEATVTVRSGEARDLSLRLTRDVPTPGWIAADTHIHTLELSGHGDATLPERALTLAGEGIELAIATEHNRSADYSAALSATGAAAYVTPMPGNEVTTPRGHFNVFPANEAVAVLNHPHDTHSAFTPFARVTFNAVTGASRGLARRFTAVEVVNSGAMRSDWMEPIRSWFALVNRGLRVTPVGASDSHDVSRFIVGQGRTYVRVPDTQPGHISVERAVDGILGGQVVVSLGLFPQIRMGTAGPGDLVSTATVSRIEAHVSGATWTRCDRVALFVNGSEAAQEVVPLAFQERIEKAAVSWPLPHRQHDYFVVMIASGPGVTDPSWAIARPYQPTTTSWQPVVFGLTAPIFVDADGDGVFTSARGYAQRLVDRSADVSTVLAALAGHDAIVSSHAAELLEARGVTFEGEPARTALAAAAPEVRAGITAYLNAK